MRSDIRGGAEDKAAASRAGVHTRMDQLVDRVGDVEASVAARARGDETGHR
ncbi:DUF1515 family protein [Ensifer sp. Root142]|uniref:DUF1515 family protein n=1 Tax=Ensifer sp. Root142 TaxID=1736461 RepID=UPI0009E98E1D